LIKIEREGESTYTFSPTVADWLGGTVTIKVFSPEVAGSPGGSRTLVVEKTGDTYFTAYYADSGSSFKIEVIGVKTGSWPVGGPLTALNDAGGDRRVCGYAISTVCGGCYDQRRGELF
jgi:hypothetical protein